MLLFQSHCRGGETGRHARLKISWAFAREGSSPSPGTTAGVAQRLEHLLAKEGVAGSNPVSRSSFLHEGLLLKIAVAISGASGIHLGIKTFEAIPKTHEKYLIITKNAKAVAKNEQKNIFYDEDIWAGPASGSFGLDVLMVIPCSMNTLAKIAAGIADNLTTRAASVIIKEQKKLLLAPREMPFSPIALENMHKLAMLNVIIAPPVAAYYSDQQSLEDMESFFIGKWFDLVGIENDLYKRWQP